MQELELTPRRLLSVWWLVLWRGFVLGGILGAISGAILGIVTLAAGWKDPNHHAGIIGGLVVWLPASLLVLKWAFKKQYRDFRIVLVPPD